MTATTDIAQSSPAMRGGPSVLDRAMNYVECDLDPELTLPQWRRARAAAAPRRCLRFAPVRRRPAVTA
jgi:hypothetical protein